MVKMRSICVVVLLWLQIASVFSDKKQPAIVDEFDISVSDRNDNSQKAVLIENDGGRRHEKFYEFDMSKYQAQQNPCDQTKCRNGKECSLDGGDNPMCTCPKACPEIDGDNDKLCGTNNVTYHSVCEFNRVKCIGKSSKKTRRAFKRLKIDYYGMCQEIPSCKKRDIGEYPSRMRSWIKNIFIQSYETQQSHGGLNNRQRELGSQLYLERFELQHMEEASAEMLNDHFGKFYQLYVYPIHWKFSQLDKKPKNGKLSKRELEPLRAPLIPMEHCTKLFFKSADKNRDKMISFEEWGEAFGLKEDDLNQDMLL